jgi:thiamine-phosphate pyrophosphorylase
VTPDLIAITDDALADEQLEARVNGLLEAVPPGSTAIQLRDRRRDSRALVRLAERLRRATTDHGAALLVNDRLDIAAAVGADGVHLGGRSSDVADARRIVGASGFISVAAHAIEDVERAAREGATAALLAPIFATAGKGPPRGVAFLAEAAACAGGLHVYALGGIDAMRVPACMTAGARGVAAIGSVFGSDEGAREAAEIVATVRSHRAYR